MGFLFNLMGNIFELNLLDSEYSQGQRPFTVGYLIRGKELEVNIRSDKGCNIKNSIHDFLLSTMS